MFFEARPGPRLDSEMLLIRNRDGQISKDRGFDVDAHTTARELREVPDLATECGSGH